MGPLCIIFAISYKSIIISKAKLEKKKKKMMPVEKVIFYVKFMSSELVSPVALPAAAS